MKSRETRPNEEEEGSEELIWTGHDGREVREREREGVDVADVSIEEEEGRTMRLGPGQGLSQGRRTLPRQLSRLSVPAATVSPLHELDDSFEAARGGDDVTGLEGNCQASNSTSTVVSSMPHDRSTARARRRTSPGMTTQW